MGISICGSKLQGGGSLGTKKILCIFAWFRACFDINFWKWEKMSKMKDPPSGKIPTFFLTLPLFTCQTTNTQKWYNISLCEKGHRFQHYLEKKFKSHVASTRILLIMMKSLNIRTSRRKRTFVSCFFNILVYKAECVCACVTVSHKMWQTDTERSEAPRLARSCSSYVYINMKLYDQKFYF